MSLAPAPDAALSTTEAEHLADCETIIAAGLASFVEVGEALADVRDSRLYRQTHGTFEDYCSDRWGLSHRHVNRMVEASQVVGALGPIGPVPTNEAQARPLAPLRDDPDALASAWQAANEAAEAKGKPVTAADVAAAVKAQQPEPEPTPIDDEWEPGGWLPATPPAPTPPPAPPTPAARPESDADRDARLDAEADQRHAHRIERVAQHWHAVEGLRSHPRRAQVLALLCDNDRQILAHIEEIIS